MSLIICIFDFNTSENINICKGLIKNTRHNMIESNIIFEHGFYRKMTGGWGGVVKFRSRRESLVLVWIGTRYKLLKVCGWFYRIIFLKSNLWYPACFAWNCLYTKPGLSSYFHIWYNRYEFSLDNRANYLWASRGWFS